MQRCQKPQLNVLLSVVLILVIALPPISSDGAVCDERLRLNGLDLSTKHREADVFNKVCN